METPTDDELRELLARYNPPPDLPADRLWEAIDAAERRGGRAHPIFSRPALAVVAVALFALGGLTGYAVAGARGDDRSPVGRQVDGGGEGAVLVHRITWF